MDIASLYARFRSRSALSTFQKRVTKIGALESTLTPLTDEELQAEFKALASLDIDARITKGFAIVREASRRVKGLRQFDVQLIGGMVLLQGKLAEMRTGEGKTLTIVAPAALLALSGQGVHVVTANTYLAQRDAELMRPIYEFLGLSVSALHDGLTPFERKQSYECDITYGVGHDFGFDYLRDNLAISTEQQVQRPAFAAIIDEIDSILIDEARTPLIISGKAADVSLTVQLIDQAVRALKPSKDFTIDLKEMSAGLTDDGYAAIEAALAASGVIASSSDLYDAANLPIVRRVHSAVRAYGLYKKDKDYVVENGELVLVDAGTGRKMEGRRFEDGLHEALEAREKLTILPGSVTKASVTYQTFFSHYQRLSGLTGTALTDADEFAEIYNLEVVVIPPNKPSKRKANLDQVYLTKSQKFSAIIEEVAERHAKGQPVLLGCATIRDAEVVSRLLTSKKLKHNVLTAKHLAREAEIIAQAGAFGAITVATNMAGRGTDIALGGELAEDASPEQLAALQKNKENVINAGGLFVLGTERNGLRRVDNQLAGRSGRQGDPGEVQFMISIEDELLKTFGDARVLGLLQSKLKASGVAFTGELVTKTVSNSQQRFENQGFESRKTLMKYDKVLSDQREAVYDLRQGLLTSQGCLDHCKVLCDDTLEEFFVTHMTKNQLPEQWDLKEIKTVFLSTFGINLPLLGWVTRDELEADEIYDNTRKLVAARWDELGLTEDTCRQVLFKELDIQWTDHLTALEELRSAANLKAHSGLNPLYQFSKEGMAQFQVMLRGLRTETTMSLMAVREAPKPVTPSISLEKLSPDAKVALEVEKRWVRRLDPCPCQSGKRYKDCHGKKVS